MYVWVNARDGRGCFPLWMPDTVVTISPLPILRQPPTTHPKKSRRHSSRRFLLVVFFFQGPNRGGAEASPGPERPGGPRGARRGHPRAGRGVEGDNTYVFVWCAGGGGCFVPTRVAVWHDDPPGPAALLCFALHVEGPNALDQHTNKTNTRQPIPIYYVQQGQVIMTDVYWDLPNNLLSLANVWLRKRSGAWELKVGGWWVRMFALPTRIGISWCHPPPASKPDPPTLLTRPLIDPHSTSTHIQNPYGTPTLPPPPQNTNTTNKTGPRRGGGAPQRARRGLLPRGHGCGGR